jgi:hypothetical protein
MNIDNIPREAISIIILLSIAFQLFGLYNIVYKINILYVMLFMNIFGLYHIIKNLKFVIKISYNDHKLYYDSPSDDD